MRFRSSELARGSTITSVKRAEEENSNLEALGLLRQILFKREGEKLVELTKSVEALKTKVTAPEVLADNLMPYVGEILAKKFAESPEEMAQLLSPIVVASIKYQIKEARDDVVEILRPIIVEAIDRQIRESDGEIIGLFSPLMGRMIAKAVLEAVKNLVQKARGSLHKVFGFRNRFAKASVEPGSRVRGATPFNIEESFLIHKASGVLICHVSNQPEGEVDRDLINGMLRVIRDFVGESLGSSAKQDLARSRERTQFGSKQILLEAGPDAHIAVAVSGTEPADFRKKLMETVSRIHRRYGPQLKNYDGDNTKFTGVEEPIIALMDTYEELPEKESDASPKIKQRTWLNKLPPVRQHLVIAVIIALTVLFGGILINYYIPRNKPEVPQNSEMAPDIINQSREAQAEIETILKEKPIVFDAGKTSIPPEQETLQETLNEIVEVLKKRKLVRVHITGYSDTSDEDNIDIEPSISLGRAQAVEEYLQSKGIPPDKLEIMEGGATDKFSANTTPSGLLMNRRVAFEVVVPYEK